MQFTGHLSKNDPLYNYLVHDILVQVGADGRNGIRVFNSRSSHAVYIYEDRTSNVKVVGKFFAAGKNDFHFILSFISRKFLIKPFIRRVKGGNRHIGYLHISQGPVPTIFVNKNSTSRFNSDFFTVQFHEPAAFENKVQFNMLFMIVQRGIFFDLL